MIIFLIFLFVILFTLNVFVYTDYFKKMDALDKIIFIFTFFFIVWVLFTLYFIFCFFCKLIFVTTINHPFHTDTMIEYSLESLSLRIIYVLSFILLVMFFVLLYIFGIWMIIILYVPFIIIVPIPFIPFLLPIPLKILLLIPFKKLTDRGILPLMRRVFLGFADEETSKHLINSSYDIYGFFFDNLKAMISDFLILNEPKKNKISKGLQDDKYKRSTIDDENEETSNELIENENKKVKERLKNEYLICVKTQRKLNNYGDNKYASNGYSDKRKETDCNFDNLKSYLKYKI
jgi:hypothetical protein